MTIAEFLEALLEAAGGLIDIEIIGGDAEVTE